MENQEQPKKKRKRKRREKNVNGGVEIKDYKYYFNSVYDGSNPLYANAYAVAMTTPHDPSDTLNTYEEVNPMPSPYNNNPCIECGSRASKIGRVCASCSF